MPPKRRLPRRAGAHNNQLNLQSVAAELIDAVTCEPLHDGKYIQILSPDKTLRLYYNTSTLIRIATDHGKFMQPPHFRQPMAKSLQRIIEQIEGKKFHFQQRNVRLLADGTSREGFVNDRNRQMIMNAFIDMGNNEGGINVLHRHVYFDEIMDQFYLLNPAEVYVCPICYEHYVQTRYIPHLHRIHRRVDYVNNGEQPVIDPLDVLSHMNHQEYSIEEDEQEKNEEKDDDDVHDSGDNCRNETSTSAHQIWQASNEPSQDVSVPPQQQSQSQSQPAAVAAAAEDNALVHVVFRRAQVWKRHLAALHCIHDISAADYRLRDVLCTYHSLYNLLNETRYEASLARGNAPRRRWALTQQRYWHMDARYNVLRYNRVVEAVEQAEVQASRTDPSLFSLTHTSAFPGEQIATDMNPTIDDDEDEDEGGDSDNDNNMKSSRTTPRNSEKKAGRKGNGKKRQTKKQFDNFIVNDDSLSSSEDDGYVPRYHPPDYLDSNNSQSDADNQQQQQQQQGQQYEQSMKMKNNDSSIDNNRRSDNRPLSSRSTGKRKGKRSQTLLMSSSSSSSSSVIDQSDTQSSVSDQSLQRSTKKVKRELFYKDGVFAPHKFKYDRLSAQDRHFVQAMQQKKVAPSQLYDPVLYHVQGGSCASRRVNDNTKYYAHDMSVSSAQRISNYNDSDDID